MQILKLTLNSNNIGRQHFFFKQLGFDCSVINEKRFEIHMKENDLIFEESAPTNYYHYCFLIPENSLESAIKFLNKKKIEVLKYQNKEIVEFEEGRACYFYDSDGNIAEFIERPRTKYPSAEEFTINSIIKINEIGFPVANPIEFSEKLEREFRIDSDFRGKDFTWAGNHHGVILLPVLGRDWLPTELPALKNSFTLEFENKGEKYFAKFHDQDFDIKNE